MSESTPIETLLPVALPQDTLQKTVLIILRRMAIHGLRDASASTLALEAFGSGFRKVLVLSRCLLQEMATASNRSIRIASCCAPRMTRDEALIMDVILRGDREALSAVTDNETPDRALSAAFCLAETLAETPLRHSHPC